MPRNKVLIGLLHLKSIHPLGKILEKCRPTTSLVWIFKCTYLVCDFWTRFVTVWLELSNELIYLEFTLPLKEMFLKSSTRGVSEFKWSCYRAHITLLQGIEYYSKHQLLLQGQALFHVSVWKVGALYLGTYKFLTSVVLIYA